MKTIYEYSPSDTFFIGVVLAEDWFNDHVPFPFTKGDYVVVNWFDYSDGVNHHIEGRTTIAMCKKLDDAKVLYNYHLNKHGIDLNSDNEKIHGL